MTTLAVDNTVANVAFTGNGSSVANAVAFANDGTLILGVNGGTQTYNGGLTTTGVGGTVTLNGTVATSNDAVVLGAVTLGSATTIDTNATNTTGDITIAAITGGKFLREENLHELPEIIALEPTEILLGRESELWNSPLYFILLLLPLTIEWFMRKFAELK